VRFFIHSSNNFTPFRLTFKVTDVLRLRIRALRSKDQQSQNVVEQNATKGEQPDWRFAEPEPPEKGGEQLPYVICRFFCYVSARTDAGEFLFIPGFI